MAVLRANNKTRVSRAAVLRVKKIMYNDIIGIVIMTTNKPSVTVQ